MYCGNCGIELPDPNQQFCPNCGIPLKYQNMIDSLKKNFEIIAGAVIKDSRIVYTTDNWDISRDIDNLLSNWRDKDAKFIMVSGVKYSILQMVPERLVAISLKGEGSIVGAKNDDYIIILQVNHEKSKNGNYPFPYIFKPPSPAGDLELAAQPQAKESITEQDIEYETYCKHCGAELPKGQTICHVCGNKVE
ncbi:MAG: zinc ribbon domain-containing protein [Promethearchaeota archaeon]